MQRLLLGLLLIVVLANAQFANKYDQPRAYATLANGASACLSEYSVSDVASRYKNANSSHVKKGCISSSEELCATTAGAVVCNKRDAKCVEAKDRANNQLLNPSIFNSMATTADVCQSEGKYTHDDASVLMPAQSTVSFIFIIIVAIVTFLRAKGGCGGLATATYFGIVITCLLLLPSYYYLNALVGMTAASIALGMYSTKDAPAVAIGMLACVTTIMWFTFEHGLGYYSQAARVSGSAAAANTENAYAENFCNNYYRFSYAPSNTDDNFNTGSYTRQASGPCARDWLAAVYFFDVLLKLLLALLVVAGASVLYGDAEEKKEQAHDEAAAEAAQE